MRHGMVNRKLGRTSAHRNAMFRNQLASLIDKERIITTLPKAKELRPQIERLITLGKNDSVHARRQAERVIADDAMVGKLFDTIGPRFAERPGGYTRIIKLGARRGDAAEMAILEFVGYEIAREEPAAATPKSKPAKKAAPAAEPAAGESSDEEAAPKKKAPAKKAAAPKKEAKEAKGKGKGGDDDKPAKKKTSSKKSK
jgi:large subunit ribosomal protein L17